MNTPQAPLTPQEEELVTWANFHLRKVEGNHILKNLSLDFRNGVALIQLLEALTSTPAGNYTREPQNLWQCMQNVQTAFRLLISQTCENVKGCTVQGTLKLYD